MPRAIDVKNIVLHTSAGFGGRESIENWWKRLGWSHPGYARLIELDGFTHGLANYRDTTNGVLGYNNESIHICYIGGIENVGLKKAPIYKAKDTRTDEQKYSLHKCVQDAICWLKDNGKDITKNLGIVGHRDYSKDVNMNGIIDPYERIKECPSFDVLKEFSYLYASRDRYMKLPTTP